LLCVKGSRNPAIREAPMRDIFVLLQAWSARLDGRSRRMLIFVSSAGLMLFAGTTVTSAQKGDYAEAAAGVVMLAAMAAVGATAWSARRGSKPRA
jgi:hypothetical protein